MTITKVVKLNWKVLHLTQFFGVHDIFQWYYHWVGR
jgi:hypothetical protein